MNKWLPIETAPKDEVVIIYDADLALEDRVQTAFWNEHLNNWQPMNDYSPPPHPTRWQPLPEPPQ